MADSEQMRTHTDEDQEPPVTTPAPPEVAEAQAAMDDEEHDEIRSPVGDAPAGQPLGQSIGE